MYHVFVSYSSANRDVAESFVRELTARGLNVWMDDADAERGDSEMGVPAGTKWRDSISAGLDSSMIVVVLDSATWRSSGVCRWEYEHALNAGKRIAVVRAVGDDDEEGGPSETVQPSTVDDDVERIVRLVAEHEAVVRAHTRLLIADSDEPTGFLGRLFGRDRVADDVEAILGGALENAGLKLSDRHRVVIEKTLASEASRRRRTRVARGSTLGVVTILAIGALAASVVAYQANSRSQVERNNQVSVLSASEAIAAHTGDEARAALKRGRHAADTDALRAATQIVEAKNRDSEIIYSGVSSPTGVAVSEDGSTIVVSEGDTLTVIHPDRDPIRLDAPGPLGAGSLTLSADGSRAVVLGAFRGNVSTEQYLLDVDSGEFELATGAFRSSALEPDGTVLTVNAYGDVLLDGALIEEGSGFAAPPVAAVGVSGGVAVLLDNGAIALPDQTASGEYRLVDRFGGSGTTGATGSPEHVAEQMEQYAPEAVSAEPASSTKPRTRPARIFACGDRVISWDRGTVQSADLDGLSATRKRVLNYLDSDQSRACFDGRGIFALGIRGSIVSVPDEGGLPRSLLRENPHAGRVAMATSPEGAWIVAARPDGTVVRALTEATARTYQDDGVFLRLPVSSGLLAITQDGGLRLDGAVLEGQRVNRLLAQRLATVEDGFWFPSGRWMYKLTDQGIETEIEIQEEIGVRDARTAADGSILMIASSAVIRIDPATGDYLATVVQLPEEVGSILDADVLASGTLVVLTSAGYVVEADADSGEVIESSSMTAGGQVGAVTRLDDGTILVMASDGVLRQLDHEFNEVRSMQWRGGAKQIDVLAGGDRVLVSGPKLGTIIVDSESFEVIDILDSSMGAAQAVTVSPDGSRVVSNVAYSIDDADSGDMGVATMSVVRRLVPGS